jgi:hypothetical protein
MARAAWIPEKDVDQFARTMTLEMGKTLASAKAEALSLSGHPKLIG